MVFCRGFSIGGPHLARICEASSVLPSARTLMDDEKADKATPSMKRNSSSKNLEDKDGRPVCPPSPSRPPTVVVKVGTSSILRSDSGHLALSTLSTLVEVLCKMRKDGLRVVLVSSGAVGVGCQRLGITTRPKGIAELQALAAVGQPHLMRYYDVLFPALHQPIAQVLLTAETLGTRSGYLNSQSTFESLFNLGVIPVVNENDTVAVRELRFGDNDTLSALVATLVGADHLFLATDVDALYTSKYAPAPGRLAHSQHAP